MICHGCERGPLDNEDNPDETLHFRRHAPTCTWWCEDCWAHPDGPELHPARYA